MSTDKADIRHRILKRRGQLTEVELKRMGTAICQRVLTSQEYRQARTLLCYASCKKEADTFGIMEAALKSGRTVALPKVTGPAKMIFCKIHSMDDLVPGFMGILEPKEDCCEEVREGLMLVPGTAFDRQMHRMGYGGGYYDAWLGTYGDRVTACGLAYDFQLLPSIPWEDHDRSMDLLMTPTMTLRRGDV